MALATRCARDLLARTGDHLAAEPVWEFEPANGDQGPLTVAVATVALENKRDVVAKAQALMAAMEHTARCSQCDDWQQMNLYRFERGLTIREACASLGLNSRAFYRHQLIHPTNSNGRPA
jgi:hypothetical protein